jgi:signal peptidase I
VQFAVRDMSPPSGRSEDGSGETPFGVYGAARRSDAPRHLAGARQRSDSDRSADVEPVDAPSDVRDAGPASPPPDAADQNGSAERGRATVGGVGRTIIEWLVVIGCGILIAVGARAFLVQAFWIPSPSMAPTLEPGDRVLVNKLAYKAHEVNHGDLVVFERPPQASNGEDDEIKDLIKRVVAVGGDTIEARDGLVYVNGERIEEPYLVEGTPTDNLPLREIPEGMVFVMGDNRTNSEDGRVFGPIDEDTIVGRAFVTVLPISQLGWL